MSTDLTGLLGRWRQGDLSVEGQILEQTYPLLRALVRKQLGSNRAYTMQATELAHEAYLKLAEQKQIDWQSRGHFFAIAGRLVRRVVIDYLRERQAQKRGGAQAAVPLHELDEADCPAEQDQHEWLRLDSVLCELERFDPDGAKLVEQRYFAGLSVPQIAKAAGVSESTIARQWRTVRAWLEARITQVESTSAHPS